MVDENAIAFATAEITTNYTHNTKNNKQIKSFINYMYVYMEGWRETRKKLKIKQNKQINRI